ncbi:cytochrome P450 [Hyaloscypha finlandica]|nr:cytochrome P450 [Hyaloscypha finlandica]
MNSSAEALCNRNGSWVLAVLAGGVVILLAVGLYSQGPRSKYPVPPGPKGSPIIGNLRQVPAERSDLQFAKWAKEYKSDIIYVNLLGQPVIVLNSVKSAVDLLNKKGAIYSDRPRFVLLEALGFKNNLALTRDGAQFRKLRKPYGSFLSARSSLGYRDSQLKHAREMADEIEKCPEKWQSYLSRFATRVIFSVAFAIDVVDENDPYFKLADKMGWIDSNMEINGITILDIAPWLEHIPRWMGKFIPSVKYVHDHTPTIEELHQRPFDAVMRSFVSCPRESQARVYLIETHDADDDEEDEDDIKSFTDGELRGTGGSLYSAGQETIYSAETIFVMAMVLTTDVQIRAQKEIDAVTRGIRLPTFSDWETLPIVERIVYETLRWRFHPPIPNGVPHKTLKEDVYRDMYIPKGNSMVIANAWAMLHDPDIYKDPLKFNPDRFLPVSESGGGEPIPMGHFGFGRRVCPGQYLGFASVWIVVATILAKFSITPAKDKDGEDIMPKMEFSTGITRYDLKLLRGYTCVIMIKK